MGRKEFENVTEEWEMRRLRRLRNARVNRVEARKDEAFKKIYGYERPKAEPEGKLIYGVPFFKGAINRKR